MKTFRPIVSFTLALLVLVSSTSFMVGIHFCGGSVQNIALFTKADGCEMEKELPPCHRKMKTSCCDDETVIHEGEDFNSSITEVSIPPISVATLVASFIIVTEVIPEAYLTQSRYFNEHSPHRADDFIVSHRQLLI